MQPRLVWNMQVMSAISSNNERWGIMDVTLELERPADASAGS